MENKSFESDNIHADLTKSWHIPRPTLARSSNSQGSTSSNNSTQSARSGSLLLTAANLAQIQDQNVELNNKSQNIQYYLQQQTNNNIKQNDLLIYSNDYLKKRCDPDSISLASSMHFTVVNMNTRPVVRSFCRKHQLTILVTTMSILFTIGILIAVIFLEIRARQQQINWTL